MSANVGSPGVLQQFVERSRQLYSLPAVAVKVLELADRPEVDVPAMKECIENDPALTAKILRVVNSSLFGLSRDVTDLNQALALLGVNPLKLLVLGFSLPKNLFNDVEADVLERYWRHTLIKAVACREISMRVFNSPGDEAFIAGLLQGIGILVFLQDLGEPYVQFLSRVYQEGGDLAALETATLGFDHAVLSARLLQHWGLPERIVQAVALPHDAQRLLSLPPEERPLPQALHIAELMVTVLTHGRADALNELHEVAARYGGPTAEQLSELTGDLEEKVQHLADVLSVRLPEHSDYTQVLLKAHAQLCELAEQAAAGLANGEARNGVSGEESRSLAAALERAARGVGQNRSPADPGPAHSPRLNPSRLQPPVTGRAQLEPKVFHTDPGLRGRVASAVADCRQSRCPISLALMEVDEYDWLVMNLGVDRAAHLMDQLESAVESLLAPPDCGVRIDDACFALVLSDCEREQAVESVKRMVHDLRQWSPHQPEGNGRVLTFSAGLATLSLPPRNYPAADLIEAAERCLNGARSAGGDGLKSILI